MRFLDHEVKFKNVYDARQKGISAVFQEFSLVDTLTVAQNLFLGEEPLIGRWLDNATLQTEAQALLDKMGFALDAHLPVSELSRAEKQMVEIAKALRGKLSVLILDEPTASLTHQETEQLFALISELKKQASELSISLTAWGDPADSRPHHRAARRRYIGTRDIDAVQEQDLIAMMTGREIENVYPHVPYTPGNTVLEVRKLTTRNQAVSDLSFHVRAGEIVALPGWSAAENPKPCVPVSAQRMLPPAVWFLTART